MGHIIWFWHTYILYFIYDMYVCVGWCSGDARGDYFLFVVSVGVILTELIFFGLILWVVYLIGML